MSILEINYFAIPSESSGYSVKIPANFLL